jgi:hypothetical protein
MTYRITLATETFTICPRCLFIIKAAKISSLIVWTMDVENDGLECYAVVQSDQRHHQSMPNDRSHHY